MAAHFLGIANSSLPIQNVQELTDCVQTLEAYNLTKCSDYPNTDVTQMASINIQTGTVNPTVVWTSQDLVTGCGQRAEVVSSSSTNGEVDLYYHVSTEADVPVPLYRYWNPQTTDHFYTTNWNELGTGKWGYGYEGIQCYVHANALLQTVPLYRYWNPETTDHFYTTNFNELGTGKWGYGYEGIQCYVHSQPIFNSVPLYRYWNPGTTDHFYTTNLNELGAGKWGYGYEGIQCYVHVSPVVTPGPRADLSLLQAEGPPPPTFTTSLPAPAEMPPATFSGAPGLAASEVPSSFRLSGAAIGGTAPYSSRMAAEGSRVGQPAQRKITIVVE